MAASVAAVNTLILTICGSHTNASMRLPTQPSSTFTPYHMPSTGFIVCSCLNLLRTSVPSIPELSASCLGMISRALAKPLHTSDFLPFIRRTCSRRYLESSISIAPPPATTACVLTARRTIMIASLSERAASSMYWEAPPRITIVTVLVPAHSVKKLYLSEPSCLSSNLPQFPRTFS